MWIYLLTPTMSSAQRSARRPALASAALAISGLLVESAAAVSVNVSFDASVPLFELLPTYLSVNIDSGALYQDFD